MSPSSAPFQYPSVLLIGATTSVVFLATSLMNSFPSEAIVETTPVREVATVPDNTVNAVRVHAFEAEPTASNAMNSVILHMPLILSEPATKIRATIAGKTSISMTDETTLPIGSLGIKSHTVSGALRSFDFGIENVGLNFSIPVEISVPISDAEEGSLVRISVRHGDSKEISTTGITLNKNATCSNGVSSDEDNKAFVSNGLVTFYTCAASLFIVDSGGATVSTVTGGCDGVDYVYDVYWNDDSGIVTSVDVVDSLDNVLGSGSISPIAITIENSKSTSSFSIRVRDTNNITDVSDPATVNPEICPSDLTGDWDGDGVINYTDLDDDNDGVLDSVECVENLPLSEYDLAPGDFAHSGGVLRISTPGGTVSSLQQDGIDLVVWNIDTGLNWRNFTYQFFEADGITPMPIRYFGARLYDIDNVVGNSSSTERIRLSASNAGTPYTITSEHVDMGLDVTYDSVNDYYSSTSATAGFFTDLEHSLGLFIEDPVDTVVIGVREHYTGKRNFGFSSPSYCAGFKDTDMDGIPNHLDLDSDNDGISDLVESG